MKFTKLCIVLIILLGANINSQAQNADTLSLKTNFMWGDKIYKGDMRISVKQVLNEMKTIEPAYKLMKSAKFDLVLVQIVGSIGGFLVGWPIGNALGGGNPDWTLAVVGTGLIALSIPMTINFRKKTNLAFREYNSLITGSNKWNYKPVYHFGLTGNGLQLRIRF